MLIEINKNQIDNRSEEKIYEDYLNKRENLRFLSRVIIVDIEHTSYQHYNKGNILSLKNIEKHNEMNINNAKKKLKKNYKSDLVGIT